MTKDKEKERICPEVDDFWCAPDYILMRIRRTICLYIFLLWCASEFICFRE